MATAVIGGVAHEVALPNFKKLKAAWRHIAAVQVSSDPMASVEAILGIVSVGAAPPATLDELEEALTPAELPGLRTFINDLMAEIGFASGEAPPAKEVASPSTATSTTSSAPSSPDSAAPTGT